MTSPNTCPVCSGLLFGGACRSCHQRQEPKPCPYAVTCLASRLPKDDICRDCTVVQRAPREAVAGAGEPDLLAVTRERLGCDRDTCLGCPWSHEYPGRCSLTVEPSDSEVMIEIAAVERDGEVTP